MQEPINDSLMDPETRRCPFDFYRRLRRDSPVYKLPNTEIYFVATYDLITRVIKDTETFTSRGKNSKNAPNYCEEADRLMEERGWGRLFNDVPTLQNNDPPSHSLYRKLVAETFRVSRIRKMETYIGDIVEQLLEGFADRRECDIVEALCIPLPMYVIADQLGVARGDFERFKGWSEAFIYALRPPKPKQELIRDAEILVEMQHYMMAVIQDRRAHPKDDIISELVTAFYNGERMLTDKEVLSIVEQLLVAGNETTTNGVANALLYLSQHLDMQNRLRAEPDRVGDFVEEILRTESPVVGLYRTATRDTELAGVRIPKSATVMLGFAAANRDESRYDDADIIDIDRPNIAGHIAFSAGTHHCIGAELARVELRAAIQAFLRRFRHFSLAVPERELTYQYMFALRGVVKLPLRLQATAPPPSVNFLARDPRPR